MLISDKTELTGFSFKHIQLSNSIALEAVWKDEVALHVLTVLLPALIVAHDMDRPSYWVGIGRN